jgi:K+-transporting ATPase A subunit
MKRSIKVLFIIGIFAATIVGITRVFALENPLLLADTCSGYLGSPSNPKETAYWIQVALNVMRYIAIILLIVMSSFDYIKAVVAQDNDALKKANMTFIKRLAFCVIIFFVPVVVKFIMGFLGAYDTCGIK